MRQIITAIFLLCFPALCLGNPIPFDSADKIGYERDAQFTWSNATSGFSLSAQGVLSPVKNYSKTELRLPINSEEWIERLLVQKHDNDLILAFETSDGESGLGYICRLTWPQNTIRWCQTIPGFNLRPSSSKGSVYIGAIGFIGRLDPTNGKYLWQHDGLYQKDHTLNLLCLAKDFETTVVFNATSGITGTEAKQISIDRNTGNIIRTSVIGKVDVCH